MKRFIIAGIFLLCASLSFAQGPKDMVINEILVNNVTNYEDDYGHRVSWVELFNSGYSQVNLASCFLVIESDGESIAYRIPKNDTRTTVAPQGYIVFFCEGTQTKGTFHTNFTLAMDKSVETVGISNDVVDSTAAPAATAVKDKIITLSLINANKKDTISKVTYNLAEQEADIAMGRLKTEDGDGFIFTKLNATTPYATNDTSDPVPAHEQFRQTDPIGYGMAITAMTVVLAALLTLYLIFRTVGKTMVRMANRKKGSAENTAAPATKSDSSVSGEDVAAIAVALKMFADDLHDQESTVLTINRVAKHYSPWSSKLYGMTQLPNRK